VSVGLPFGIGTADWETDESERRAAWALYVQLVTRVAVQDPRDGALRDALTSLHAIFDVTRTILVEAGPDIDGPFPSVASVAVTMLNDGLRPFLSKWHPALMQWESCRKDVSPVEHERMWHRAEELRGELRELRGTLRLFADGLRKIAGGSDERA
jgi:hypothetical protein